MKKKKGNNDVFPHNTLPVGSSELLNEIANVWRKHNAIPEDSLSKFEEAGYYSYSITPETRVISLNTLYYFAKWCDKNMTECTGENSVIYEDDPASQFQWLTDELEDCKLNNQG